MQPATSVAKPFSLRVSVPEENLRPAAAQARLTLLPSPSTSPVRVRRAPGREGAFFLRCAWRRAARALTGGREGSGLRRLCGTQAPSRGKGGGLAAGCAGLRRLLGE